MSIRSEEAAAVFSEGFSCSQAVLSTFSEDLGVPREQALKISCGFGSGLSQTGDLCGAVTGAYMVIGLMYGKSRADDNEARDKTFQMTRQFMDEFKAGHGSVNCTRLVGYDLSDPQQLTDARASGVFQSVCPKLIKDSVELLEKLTR